MKLPENFLTKFFDRDNPPALNRGKRGGTLSLDEIRGMADAGSAPFQSAAGRAAYGLLLLWHDHWDEAHRIAQSDEGEPHHDLMHAIAHRREGDFPNAGYWFRSSRPHAAYAVLAERVRNLIVKFSDSVTTGNLGDLRGVAAPEGAWDPAAFLKAVRLGKPDPDLLRALQAEEILALFESWTA